jgi:pSer/pThr/pTyr-binding forkhead associated (FHA) protein
MADLPGKSRNHRLEPQDDPITIPGDTFLIMENSKVYIINQPITDIGRRLENTVVVDDPRVSRSHAQIRIVDGQYVLQDMQSTGGTFVNGQRIEQTNLYSGDVISLAGVKLTFKQHDAPPRPDLAETSPF